MRARLVEVRGDQEEFADLIGCAGELRLDRPYSFLPDGRGDWLEMPGGRLRKGRPAGPAKRQRKGRPVPEDRPARVSVRTSLGNTFVFEELPTLSEEDWAKVFRYRCRSRKGEHLAPEEHDFCHRAYQADPERYCALDRDVFNATVPFGSSARYPEDS